MAETMMVGTNGDVDRGIRVGPLRAEGHLAARGAVVEPMKVGGQGGVGSGADRKPEAIEQTRTRAAQGTAGG